MDTRDLRKIDFFAACSEAELRDLAGLCRPASYRRLQLIHEEGAPAGKVYAVLRGEVVLHAHAAVADEPTRLAVVRSGEMFGFGEVLLRHYYTSASALTACGLLEIGRDDFRRSFLAVPAIREHVLVALSQIVRYLVNKVTGGGGINDLALFLLAQGEAHGTMSGGKIHLQKKLRQPEIASVLNLSREHVTRLFAKLKAQGVVDFNRGFPVVDRAWLDRVVQDKDLAASIQYRDAPF